MAELKVLIADDEADVLEIMSKKISAGGYDVITAQNGALAWDKILKEAPDIILLDLVMPEMDGFEVLKKLREATPAGKWQPVIIVSARDELEDMQKGFSMEADHYITKPCNMEDVLKGIKLMANLIPQRKTTEELKREGQ